MALHGYGQPSDEMFRYAVSLAPADAVVVAPEGPSAFYRDPRSPGGAAAGGVLHGWIADPRREDAERRNDGLIDAALAAAHVRTPIDPRRTVLLGYSQGVGVAVHWWLARPDAAAGLVALAGGVTPPTRPSLSRLAGRPTLWVTGRRDRAYPPEYEEPLLAALREAGLSVESHALDAGHALLEPAADLARAWIRRRTAPAPDGR